MAQQTDASPTTLTSTWLAVTTSGTETGIYVQRLDGKGDVRWFSGSSAPASSSNGHLLRNGADDINVDAVDVVYLKSTGGASVMITRKS